MNKHTLINNIYKKLSKCKFLLVGFHFISYFYRKITVISVPSSILKNLEGIEHMNISHNDFVGMNRKQGISGILRTKNGEEYIESVVNSCIKYLDELVIINNLSEDLTDEIVHRLLKKYPDKIKYYKYDYKIYREEGTPGNSLHSLAYYYNWSFSKATYSIVGKIDDDGIFIKNIFKKQIKSIKRMGILSKYIYFYYWGLNLLKHKNKIGVATNNPYSGKMGDIGFYYQTKKTYYIQEGDTEKFVSDKLHWNLGLSYIHMKYLKKDYGLAYSPPKKKEERKKRVLESGIGKISTYTNKINYLDLKKII